MHWLTVPASCTGTLALPGTRDLRVAAREFVYVYVYVCGSVCLSVTTPAQIKVRRRLP